MRRITLNLLSLVLWAVLLVPAALATESHPITMNDLPKVAHQFLSMHFAGAEIISMQQDDDDTFDREYRITLDNGVQIEFNRHGQWESVRCCTGAVPDAIVPRQILEFVVEQYPGSHITEIEREKDGYEARLESGCALEFDTRLMFRKARK